MDLCVYLPLVITLIIALPLDQVFQTIVMHLGIQYHLNLILLLAVNESCGWGWHGSSARDGIRKHGGQLDHREDGVKAAEVGRESKAVCTMADTSFDEKGA
jgi:hypothetical protein